MMHPRCAVFDLDGTLIDSAPDLHVAANRLLTEEGQPALSLAQVRAMVGEGVSRLVERLFDAFDITLSETALERYTDRFRALYLEEPCTLTQPMPGARACLDALAGDHVLALCTNKPVVHTRAILEHLDLARCFASVVGGDSLAVRKPDPAPLRLAIDEAGGRPGMTVFIGDSRIDLATGEALGVPVVLVEGGYSHVPATAMPAQAHARDLREVPALVRSFTAS